MRNLLALFLMAAVWPAGAESLLGYEAREHLKALIALDTTNPPGNEILAAEYLKKQLDRAGIAAEIHTSSETRSSLIAHLRASKDSLARRPLILMCHTDVVPADPKEWASDPFTPVEKEGYLYGRGAADNKSMCAAELAVMLALKRSTAPMNRDVIFFAEADEESGERRRHIDWLLKHYGDSLDARYAINEGGNTIWKDGAVAEIRVQAAEKEYMDITLTARGEAGHASVPRAENPIAVLARAVTRLSEHRFAAHLNSVVGGFLERQAEMGGPELQAAIREVLSAAPGVDLNRAAENLAAVSPEFAAMLRNTLSPTIFKAGYKSNVIPGEASAWFNARLLPGQNPKEFIAEIAAVVDNPAVEIGFEPPARPSVGIMTTHTDFYRSVEDAAKELAPGAAVMPFMAAWTTDSQNLRAREVVVYGINPPLSLEDGGRVHGKDERISLAALDWYARFLHAVVLKIIRP